MSENVNDSASNSAEVASAIVRDPEIRKLSPGSEEYTAAVTKLTENIAKAPASQAKSESVKDSDTGNDEDKKKSSKTGLERRFSEITGERDEARRKAADLESRLAALEQTRSESKPVEKQSESSEPRFIGESFSVPKPELSKYDTYSDYQEAIVDWKFEKKEFDIEQKKVVAEANEVQKNVVSSWDTKEAATKSRVEGYEQLVDKDFIKDFTSKIASREAMQYLLESDNGPDLLYELAEDDAKLTGFKSMSVVKQVAYLSRLDSKYESESDSKDTHNKPTVSKAPAPSKSIPKGQAAVAKDITKGVQSFADYQEWRNQNRKKK